MPKPTTTAVLDAILKDVAAASGRMDEGTSRLMAVLADDSDELAASRRRSTVQTAGEAIRALSRELVSDLGEHDLVGDDGVVLFAAMVALGHVLT